MMGMNSKEKKNNVHQVNKKSKQQFFCRFDGFNAKRLAMNGNRDQ